MLLSSRTPPERLPAPGTRGAALTGGARVDVCIVGGGLSELIAAYYIAREKRSVILMHEGPIGGPHASTELAHLSAAMPQPYEELERVHGAENAKLAAQSYAAALDALEAIVRRERIGCELERVEAFRPCAPADAEREAEAARRAGVAGIKVSAAPQAGVRYPAQLRFHPRKLFEGLARAIAREGGRIHGVVVKSLETGKPSVVVTGAGHRIEAAHVVMPGDERAGGAPAIDRFSITGLEGCDAESVYVSAESWGSPVTRAIVAGMSIRDFVVGARAPEVEAAAPSGHLVFERDFS